MRNPKAKPLQQYIALWAECQKAGNIPAGPVDADDAITGETTLINILKRMSVTAEKALETKSIDQATISGIKGRSFWLILASDNVLQEVLRLVNSIHSSHAPLKPMQKPQSVILYTIEAVVVDMMVAILQLYVCEGTMHINRVLSLAVSIDVVE